VPRRSRGPHNSALAFTAANIFRFGRLSLSSYDEASRSDPCDSGDSRRRFTLVSENRRFRRREPRFPVSMAGDHEGRAVCSNPPSNHNAW